MSVYQLASAGEAALDILRQGGSAKVIGVTSRGIFCAALGAQVFFLSYETWRGPLTANIYLGSPDDRPDRLVPKGQRRHPPAFDRLDRGSAVKIDPDRIIFEAENIILSTANAVAWKAIIRPLEPGGLADACKRLQNIARLVLDEGSDKGWIAYIAKWTEIGTQDFTFTGKNEVINSLVDLSNSLNGGNGAEISKKAALLMGRGSGLTPSGDDFLVGLLLGLRAQLKINPKLRIVNEQSQILIELAHQKTTTLAANLIACALEGQADERLVSALDGILWGSLPAADCARRLLDYGSSSGGDTLLGMAVALMNG